MADRTDQQQEKVSLGARLKRGGLGWRILIGLLLTMCLTLFLHFREVRMEALELDTQAKNYVVAQVDFSFADEESTYRARQDAIREIGPIFRLSDQSIHDLLSKFNDEISQSQDWKESLPDTEFLALYGTSQAVEQALKKARFTDNRTLQSISSAGVAADHNYLFTPPVNADEVCLPKRFWNELSARMEKQSNVNLDAMRYTVEHVRQKAWALQEDKTTQKNVRDVIFGNIKPKYTAIKAGMRIIDQGEKVTSRHIAMMQGMKRELAAQHNLWQPLTILGSFLFALVVVALGGVYFRIFHQNIFYSVQKLAIFATIFIVTMGLAKGTEYFLLETNHHLIEIVRYPLFTPFAAILICILVDHGVAMFTVLFLSVIFSATLAVEHNRFLFLNVVTGVVAVIATRGVRKRKEVFAVSAKVWICCVPVLVAFNFAHNILWNTSLFYDVISTLIFMLVTAVLVVGFLPILESIFHVMTDITLMEYMDPNNELLRRLSIEAPGTYQHSLVVGILSESAAYAIGANGLFCRVVALYHDIGKLFNPHYFTENQMGGFNIHQLLTPLESTQVIIAHVAEGEALAKKHNLPKSFIDIICEHHGTTLVYFFYSKQVEQMGGDVDAVDEKQFRYPGRKPRSKESAILMIADSVEAASRSLEEMTEENLSELIDRVVNDKAEEGQFDECQLTFEELGIVKRTILKHLAATRHARVVYPERNR